MPHEPSEGDPGKQWRGFMASNWTGSRSPMRTPVVTLREAARPPARRGRCKSRLPPDRLRGFYLKVEGGNPTGSFEGPGA